MHERSMLFEQMDAKWIRLRADREMAEITACTIVHSSDNFTMHEADIFCTKRFPKRKKRTQTNYDRTARLPRTI